MTIRGDRVQYLLTVPCDSCVLAEVRALQTAPLISVALDQSAATLGMAAYVQRKSRGVARGALMLLGEKA